MNATNSLLLDLTRIQRHHNELFDGNVMNRIHDAITSGFVRQDPKFAVPEEFGMFESVGNVRVNVTLTTFIDRAIKEAASMGLTSAEQRMLALQSNEGNSGSDAGALFAGKVDNV